MITMKICVYGTKHFPWILSLVSVAKIGKNPLYYSCEKVAPILTIFWEATTRSFVRCKNYVEGWVTPNIYYLGTTGVINLMDSKTGDTVLNFGGLGRIYKS